MGTVRRGRLVLHDTTQYDHGHRVVSFATAAASYVCCMQRIGALAGSFAVVILSIVGFDALPTTAADGPDVVTIVPARLFESRNDAASATIDDLQLGGGRLAAGTETQVQITGRANVPTSATAAIINITGIRAQNPGFITAYPCGATRPNASTLNFTGTNIANGAIIPIGTAGKICIYTSATTHLAVDITGYIPADTDVETFAAARLFESRDNADADTIDGLQLGGGTLAAGTETQVQVTGRAGVPNSATAAIINITGIRGQEPGFMTVYPCGATRPNASTLNFTGTNIANGAIIPIGTAGKICIYTSATTHLVFDISGYVKEPDGTTTTTTTLSPATSPPTAREFVNAGFQRWCESGLGIVRCTSFVTGAGSTTTEIVGFETATAVGVGLRSVCARLANETVRCFGSNDSGQLGDGTLTDSQTPVEVVGINNARDVDAGLSDFACATRRTGRVACWGTNTAGQLGDGTTTDSATPVEVVGITNAVAVTTGGTFACALLADRTVRCWGSGFLGDGRTSDAATQVAVIGLSKVTMISAGFQHACASTLDGSVVCWGENSSGQIGKGDRDATGLTHLAVGLDNVVAVATGDAHSCARLSTGQIACWGENDRGQTGAAAGDDVLVPRVDPNVTDAIGIAGGVRFAITISS